MKLLLSASFLFVLAASAVAQQGLVVVNVGGVNCASSNGEAGFDATSYSLSGKEVGDTPGSLKSSKAPSLADLTITKNFDVCSEQLIQLFLSDKVISSLVLTQYGTSALGTPFAALTIKLTNATISNYEVKGAPSVHPTEALSFSYTKVCVTSVEQKRDGSAGSPVTVCYDVLRNVVN
jgi:type VI protein secretion system component Hcp